MKKILFFLMLSVTAISFAQEESLLFISKGTFELSGSFSINALDSEQEAGISSRQSFSLTVSPQLGVAISDDFILGLGLGFNYAESELTDGDFNNEFNARRYSIAPYAKKYFSITKSFAFNIQGEINYSFRDSNIDPSGLNSRDWFIGFRPGLNFRLNDKFALQAQLGTLGYSRSINALDTNNESSTNNFGFNLSTEQLNFGLLFFFK